MAHGECDPSLADLPKRPTVVEAQSATVTKAPAIPTPAIPAPAATAPAATRTEQAPMLDALAAITLGLVIDVASRFQLPDRPSLPPDGNYCTPIFYLIFQILVLFFNLAVYMQSRPQHDLSGIEIHPAHVAVTHATITIL
jgi:hypothetical protein